MRVRTSLAALLASLAGVGALAGTAPAAVQLGPNLDFPPPTGGLTFAAVGCQQGLTGRCSFFNDAWVANPAWPAVATGPGVITLWRFRGGCCLEDDEHEHRVVLRVFRQGDRPTYEYVKVAVRTGAAYVLPAGGRLLGSDVVEVPDRLPIDAGQWPGINVDWPMSIAGKAATGNTIRFMQPAPPDAPPGTVTPGTPYEASSSQTNDVVIMFHAIVEPDADRDGFGDETQDCAPGDPGSQTGCEPVPPPPPPPPPPAPLIVGVGCPSPCSSGGGTGGASAGGGGAATYIVFGGTPPAARPGGFIVPVACPPGSSVNCTGTVDITLNGGRASAAKRRLLGRARFSVAPGGSKQVSVKLSRAGRRLLLRGRRRTVTVTLRPSGGPAVSVQRTVSLSVLRTNPRK
jgi:hypothetical protein